MLMAAVFMFRGHPTCDETTVRSMKHPVASALKMLLPGLAVGSLTGMVGIGGGFLIVPALVVMRTSLREAVGTSLLIITGTCLVGFFGYLGDVSLDWRAVALVAAGTLPGIAVGSHLHQFVPQSMLSEGSPHSSW